MHIRYAVLRNRVPQDGHVDTALGKDSLHLWQTVVRLSGGVDDAEFLVAGNIV